MTEPKFTPGPWEMAYQDQHGQLIVRGKHIEVATCWHHSVGAIEKEMHANAHLIAAAPELYEALEYVMTAHGEQLSDAFEKAQAALAKARGEG